MARVTVEDCLKNVKNRFELVHIAAKRTRQLMHGKDPKVDWDNDKPTVVALREIAAGYTNFVDEPEEVVIDINTTFSPTVAIKEEEDEDLEIDMTLDEEDEKPKASTPHLEGDEK